jgi:transposase InsO family protein
MGKPPVVSERRQRSKRLTTTRRWDNACSETPFGSLKVERLHDQRFITRRHAKDETLAWLLWYNQSRLHSTLNYVSPMQFEQHWLTEQVKQSSS